MPTEVPLTKGYVTLIDDADAEVILRHKWQAKILGRTVYAMRTMRINGKPQPVPMHRLLLGQPPGMDIDHIDGDGLNNQRANLRQCTRLENGKNQRRRTTNSTGFKGVHFGGGKFHVQIMVNRKQHHIGAFATAEAAALAYDEAARRLHGEFARLNFPAPDAA